MAKRSYLKGFLSDINLSSDQETIQKEEIKSKLPKYKKNKYKGFYITPENEIRLKEIQTQFLKQGQRLDESDILNKAIELMYSQIMNI